MFAVAVDIAVAAAAAVVVVVAFVAVAAAAAAAGGGDDDVVVVVVCNLSALTRSPLLLDGVGGLHFNRYERRNFENSRACVV